LSGRIGVRLCNGLRSRSSLALLVPFRLFGLFFRATDGSPPFCLGSLASLAAGYSLRGHRFVDCGASPISGERFTFRACCGLLPLLKSWIFEGWHLTLAICCSAHRRRSLQHRLRYRWPVAIG
jgi:hypothetical protein